jgi:RNA polymerase sigma factor (sigma-70 family)
LKRRASAEDAAADTFLRFYQYASSGKRIGNVKALLFTICRNVSFDIYNKSKKNRVIQDEDMLEGIGSVEDIRLSVQEALNRLDDDERDIAVLHCVSGLKHKEIAEVLALPEGTVRWKYRLALDKLRNELGDERNE